MDRKAIAILVIAFGLLLGLQPLARWLFPVKPRPAAAGTNAAPATASSSVTHASGPVVPSLQGVQSLPSPPAAPATPEFTLALTNASARWVFTSRGGGLKHVELPGHAAFTGRHAKGRSNGPILLNHDSLPPSSHGPAHPPSRATPRTPSARSTGACAPRKQSGTASCLSGNTA